MADTIAALAAEVGALVERKQIAYGSAYSKAGDVLRLWFEAAP